MIAACPPPAAMRAATAGISHAPGTRTTSTASSAMPWLAKVSRAPATSAPLLHGFQRLAMIAKRQTAGARRSHYQWAMQDTGAMRNDHLARRHRARTLTPQPAWALTTTTEGALGKEGIITREPSGPKK